MSYIEPLFSILFLVAVAGALRLPKCKGRKLLLTGLAGLFLLSWPPADWLFSRHLAAWYPIRPLPPAPADAIVVLSSAVDTPHYERPYPLPDQYTYSRCRFAAWLYQNWERLPVLASGGQNKPNSPAFAVSMRGLLIDAGVPDAGIWTEERSRNTHENALYSAEILRSHGISRIVLVVEDTSMLRAAACFRKAGITVVPAPSEFRQWEPTLDETLLSWKAVRQNELTLHETLGLIWYKLRGWI